MTDEGTPQEYAKGYDHGYRDGKADTFAATPAPLGAIDLRSEDALDAFIAGLDSPWHSPESRRGWCRLFLRDAAMGVLRLVATPLDDPLFAASNALKRMNRKQTATPAPLDELIVHLVKVYGLKHPNGCDQCDRAAAIAAAAAKEETP